jgi:hypothetical protein
MAKHTFTVLIEKDEDGIPFPLSLKNLFIDCPDCGQILHKSRRAVSARKR